MNYSEIMNELEQASLFDIYRLKVAMSALLEQPEKIRALKQQLRVGMQISYFSFKSNALVNGILEEIQRTCVCVRNANDGRKWSVPLYALNLANVNTDINLKQTQEKYDRNQFHVGENISFIGKNEIETYGTITQLNPKTASIITRDGSRWRVSYSHLFKIFDSEAKETAPRQMIDAMLIEG
jgi:hypothetical protein